MSFSIYHSNITQGGHILCYTAIAEEAIEKKTEVFLWEDQFRAFLSHKVNMMGFMGFQILIVF